jgi:two-component system sensor histidine kinase UhpB
VQINISLDKNLYLTVTDNGQGCHNTHTTGFGLRGMKERVNSLGGEFQLISAQQQGMTIKASIPIQ